MAYSYPTIDLPSLSGYRAVEMALAANLIRLPLGSLDEAEAVHLLQRSYRRSTEEIASWRGKGRRGHKRR